MHTDGCRLCVHTVHVPDIPVGLDKPVRYGA